MDAWPLYDCDLLQTFGHDADVATIAQFEGCVSPCAAGVEVLLAQYRNHILVGVAGCERLQAWNGEVPSAEPEVCERLYGKSHHKTQTIVQPRKIVGVLIRVQSA